MAIDPDNQELSQADIDAALGGAGEASGAAAPNDGTDDSAGMLSQADIDAALSGDSVSSDSVEEQTPAEPVKDERLDSASRPFDEVATAIEAAVAEEKAAAVTAAAAASPPSMEDFSPATEEARTKSEIGVLNDVNLNVKIELGRTRMLVEEVLHLGDGSVVELDKLAGDPVDVYVNERLVARGEVLVLNEIFCVRISEIVGKVDQREFTSAATV